MVENGSIILKFGQLQERSIENGELQGTEVGRSWAVQSSVMSINQKLPVAFVFTALVGFPLGTSLRNGEKNNVFSCEQNRASSLCFVFLGKLKYVCCKLR